MASRNCDIVKMRYFSVISLLLYLFLICVSVSHFRGFWPSQGKKIGCSIIHAKANIVFKSWFFLELLRRLVGEFHTHPEFHLGLVIWIYTIFPFFRDCWDNGLYRWLFEPIYPTSNAPDSKISNFPSGLTYTAMFSSLNNFIDFLDAKSGQFGMGCNWLDVLETILDLDGNLITSEIYDS